MMMNKLNYSGQFFIPENLNIEMILRDNPPRFGNFKKEHLLYILSLISTIPAGNKDLLIKDGFVPINSAQLQKKVRNYREYIDYLIDCEIILTDNHYLKNKKSKGYKFTPPYSGDVIKVSVGLKGKNGRKSPLGMAIRTKYHHLLKWYTSELMIDYDQAISFISSNKEKQLDELATLKKLSKGGSSKDPFRQYNNSMVAIEKIVSADFSVSIDNNVYRLHSAITNLKSELRNFLNYNGVSLVSIDIANCQPYLSTVLLKETFWEQSTTHPLESRPFSKEKELSSPACALLCVDDVAPKMCSSIFYSNSILSSFVMLCKSAETHNQRELQKYANLVKNGEFYESLQTMFMEKGYTLNERKQIKAAVFQVLFTDNRYLGQKDALPKRVFKNAFPTIYKMFAKIKQRNKTNLPVLLQRIESHLVLLVICHRISQERPDLPLFSIHDSIITTTGNEEYVKKIITEEMTKAIGFPPKLNIDYWQPENLKFSRGESFFDSHSKIA